MPFSQPQDPLNSSRLHEETDPFLLPKYLSSQQWKKLMINTYVGYTCAHTYIPLNLIDESIFVESMIYSCVIRYAVCAGIVLFKFDSMKSLGLVTTIQYYERYLICQEAEVVIILVLLFSVPYVATKSFVEAKDGTISVASAFAGHQEVFVVQDDPTDRGLNYEETLQKYRPE
ncbi:hypothetical protein ACJIZ3_001382 [Penstemon smallii]|uniref:Uncharacterized protein n=1 Tax=Penstemon smallii TaxID=265156 RepID=A0ABD3U3F2_9LAMI